MRRRSTRSVNEFWMKGSTRDILSDTLGGALVNLIHSYTDNGDPFIRKFTDELLEEVRNANVITWDHLDLSYRFLGLFSLRCINGCFQENSTILSRNFSSQLTRDLDILPLSIHPPFLVQSLTEILEVLMMLKIFLDFEGMVPKSGKLSTGFERRCSPHS